MKKLSVVTDSEAKWLGISEFGTAVCSPSESWDYWSVLEASTQLQLWLDKNNPNFWEDEV